ncbi:hypothetical protein [Fodinicola acaciae]|uniref:hypothetical protein n=1 Tax=Fodinicola acaciae TaxID=2681555 RepID=UPI0013D70B9A|nr:hypothetical protein [Fodinicola acaciae]
MTATTSTMGETLSTQVVGRVWMRTETTDGRTVFVLRNRLTDVPVRRPVNVTYPNGLRGRLRLLGFDEATVATPLDNDWRTGASSMPGWWQAILAVPTLRPFRVPADLAAALRDAGLDLEVLPMVGQRRHAALWVQAAEHGPVRQQRIAAVVAAAVDYLEAGQGRHAESMRGQR